MKSRIVIGEVMHQRCAPVVHEFTYPVYMYAFDLDELEELDQKVHCFGYNRLAVVSLRDRDFIPGRDGSIREKLCGLLNEKGIKENVHKIDLITAARYFNYVFNPVSFYCCYRADESLICAAAEVRNTFGESHLYILDRQTEGGSESFAQFRCGKEFHVSPFNDMKGDYRFYIKDLGDSIDVRVNIVREEAIAKVAIVREARGKEVKGREKRGDQEGAAHGGKAVFVTRLSGKTIPLNSRNLLKTILWYPVTAHLSIPRIMWQAAKLRFGKGLRVYTKPIAGSEMTLRKAPPSFVQRVCLRIGRRFLAKFHTGCLTVAFPCGHQEMYGDIDSPLRATLFVKNYDFFLRSILAGDIGFGESFVDDQWDADDLVSLLRIFVENSDIADDRTLLLSYIGRFFNRVLHFGNRNSRNRSRTNISRHYDLSNELFSNFLDRSMMYSCAKFSSDDESLEEAQENKISALIEKARLTKDDHVLEIGSGWGTFAIEAAKRTGCRVTSITLSEEQRSWAIDRVKNERLEDRVSIELCDYRAVSGQYDKIVSIEMLEAVGHEYLGKFFSVCDRVLKPHGLLVVQVITIPDQKYDVYRKGCDWIQKYIFPGGLCPSLTALCNATSGYSSFVIEDVENIGAHYAKTLQEWRDRYQANWPRIRSLGFDERFQRMWGYYLSYCEAGFATRTLNTLQLVLTKPNNKNLPDFG